MIRSFIYVYLRPSAVHFEKIPASLYPFTLPPPAISTPLRYPPVLTRPPLRLNLTACARLLYDAGGGHGCWLVLPGAGMAVEIYNLSDF